MASPVLHETQQNAANSGSVTFLGLVLGVLQGDVLQLGGDTFGGAQISSVRIGANITASIGVNTNVLTVSAISIGILGPGQLLTDGGINIPQGLTITGQTSGSTGSTGTYTVSQTFVAGLSSQTMQTTDPRIGAKFTGFIVNDVLTVTAMIAGVIGLDQLVVDVGNEIVVNNKIQAFIDGNGGVGTYQLSISQPTPIGSTTIQAAGFYRIGVGFSLSVWQASATADLPAFPPGQSIIVTFGTAYDTTSLIAANFRGATLAAPNDPNVSLPAIQTGNPNPPAATFSTTLSDDLILFWIGCAVGFGGTQPWEDPAVSGLNTVTIAGSNGTWINGLNNTQLLKPIALTVYSQSVSSPQSSVSANTSATLMGGAFLVTVLTADIAPPSVPTGLMCGTSTTSSITAEWSAGAGGGPVTSYTLQWRMVGTVPFTTITSIAITSQFIGGLAPGEQIEWQVEAIGPGGSSGFSASHICTTLSVPPPPKQPQSLHRWRGQVGINWNGLALVGDAFAGVVGLSDFENFTEYGNVMRMLVTSPPLQDDRKRIFLPRFELDMEVGDGVVGFPEQEPQMMLDYSKDGGETFVGLQKWRGWGKVGDYTKRLRWLNLGNSRSWVLRLQCTDRQRRQIIGAYVTSMKGRG